MPAIDRIWKGSLSILAEQVVRGVKPIATLAVIDAAPGEIQMFLNELAEEMPEFARELKWSIGHQRMTIDVVHLYTNPIVYDIYIEMCQEPQSITKTALAGYLFGYSTDDICEYIRFKGEAQSKT